MDFFSILIDSLKASCSLGGTEVFRLGGVRRKSARLLPVLLRHAADVVGEVRVALIVRPFEDVGNGGDGREEEHEDGRKSEQGPGHLPPTQRPRS